MLTFRVCNELYWVEVIVYNPVEESYVAPVADTYLLNALLAM